jgi:hypothetical protein
MAAILSTIKKVPFSESQYLKEEAPKTQIYLHHTAGNGSAIGTAKYWGTTSDRIATAYLITGVVKPNDAEKDGDIIQCFEPKFFAYHLGLKQSTFTENKIPFKSLDKISIGIEICNWGQLTKDAKGKYINYVNREVPANEVIELESPFKKYKYWHSYTDAQLESVKKLLQYLCQTFNISKTYNEDIWGISKRALKGESGIFTHNSVRTDKVDVYPHPKLIDILKSL